MRKINNTAAILLTLAMVALTASLAFGYGSLDYFDGNQIVTPQWPNDPVIPWYIDAGGASKYLVSSDSSFSNWESVSYTDVTFQYQGTTSIVMDAHDGVNVVSFNSNYINWGGVLGFTVNYQDDPTGEILGFDIIMNPKARWSTDGTPRNNQYEVESVLTHELGHAQGLAHSVTGPATMYPFISPGDVGPASLEHDDIIGHALLYGNASFPGSYAKITGSVTRGGTGNPVPGAAVQIFIENAQTYADNVTSVYTYSDGLYELYVPAGTWLLRLDPLDGDPQAFDPSRISAALMDIAETDFPAEWWDSGENNCEDPTLATSISIGAGQTLAGFNLVTNENCSGGQPPVANFSGTPTSGTVPLTVAFTDLSSGNPDTWSWDFGDGVGTSTLQNPSYEYQNTGTYTVSLTATNAYGSDGETKVDYITATTGGSTALHVDTIDVVYTTQGPNYTGEATVTIVDQDSSPYANATVSGYFVHEGSETIRTGVTDGSGQTLIKSGKVKNPGPGFEFCFNVTDVTAAGTTYQPAVTSGCSSTIMNAESGRPGGALAVLPTSFSLEQNVPNPFNPTTNIGFTLKSASRATLEVYNVSGRKIATLVDGYLPAGHHTTTWNATDAASGVYFYRLKASDFSETRKMILLK